MGLQKNLTKSPLASYFPEGSSWRAYTESHYRVGFNVKAFVSLPLGRKFFFLPEWGFSLYQQKQLYSDDQPLNVIGSISHSEKLLESSIALDALFKYKTKYFSISAGPQMGIVTAASIKTRSRSNAYNGTFYSDTETNFSKDKKAHNPVFSLLLGSANQR